MGEKVGYIELEDRAEQLPMANGFVGTKFDTTKASRSREKKRKRRDHTGRLFVVEETRRGTAALFRKKGRLAVEDESGLKGA